MSDSLSDFPDKDLFFDQVVEIMWDEKPRSALEIAGELAMRYPDTYYLMNRDLLAQSIYIHMLFPGSARRLMQQNSDGRYRIIKNQAQAMS